MATDIRDLGRYVTYEEHLNVVSAERGRADRAEARLADYDRLLDRLERFANEAPETAVAAWNATCDCGCDPGPMPAETVPELFPGTREQLDRLTVRGEGALSRSGATTGPGDLPTTEEGEK